MVMINGIGGCCEQTNVGIMLEEKLLLWREYCVRDAGGRGVMLDIKDLVEILVEACDISGPEIGIKQDHGSRSTLRIAWMHVCEKSLSKGIFDVTGPPTSLCRDDGIATVAPRDLSPQGDRTVDKRSIVPEIGFTVGAACVLIARLCTGCSM